MRRATPKPEIGTRLPPSPILLLPLPLAHVPAPVRLRRAKGFTLIEIMVALTVLAVAMGALLSGMAHYSRAAASLRERTFAELVAHNRLTQIELEPEWPDLGRSDGDETLAGIQWRWFVEVTETQDENLRRIDVRVQAADGEDDIATLSAFLSEVGRQ